MVVKRVALSLFAQQLLEDGFVRSVWLEAIRQGRGADVEMWYECKGRKLRTFPAGLVSIKEDGDVFHSEILEDLYVGRRDSPTHWADDWHAHGVQFEH